MPDGKTFTEKIGINTSRFAISPDGKCLLFNDYKDIPATWEKVEICSPESYADFCVEEDSLALSPDGYCIKFPADCYIPKTWKRVLECELPIPLVSVGSSLKCSDDADCPAKEIPGWDCESFCKEGVCQAKCSQKGM
jgi:hypothetical protein